MQLVSVVLPDEADVCMAEFTVVSADVEMADGWQQFLDPRVTVSRPVRSTDNVVIEVKLTEPPEVGILNAV
mgnify:CR=1 FL=1